MTVVQSGQEIYKKELIRIVEKTGTTTTPDQKKELKDLIKAIDANKGTTDGLRHFMERYKEIAGKNLDSSLDTIEEFETISKG